MPLWLVTVITTAYLAGLFAIAWRGDRLGQYQTYSPRRSGIIYALGLTVYCTSWTFYGAVGTAATQGWDYLWILLGPALVFAFMPTLHRRLADIGQREGVSSLSDFLSARYGKSGGLAALAALAATTGALPYIALQLKSLDTSLGVLTDRAARGGTEDSVFAIALAMALFSILFGARGADVTQRNHGLMRVLVVEALLKLLALFAVAIFAFISLNSASISIEALEALPLSQFSFTGRSAVILLISMTVILCLPRQFHILVVERQAETDSYWANWLLPLYLILVAILVLPITAAGHALLPAGTAPDSFVLSLPLTRDAPLLGLLVFLGGVSAATGMVIVASIALSTMVTNDLIAPLLIRSAGERLGPLTGRGLILIRRGVIIGLLLLAYGYFRAAGNGPALASIGLLSFAAAAQFAPLLIGALFWKRANRTGAIIGLCLGMSVWAYTLFAPAIIGLENLQNWLPNTLDPHGLFGSDFGDSLTHGVIWSLSANIVGFLLGSVFAKERLRDRVQSVAFSHAPNQTLSRSTVLPSEAVGRDISDRDLRALASRFLDAGAVDHAFAEFAKTSPEGGWERVQQTEKLLSRVIGASSARVIMASALSGVEVQLDDVLRIFDQKSARRMFDDHGVQALLESLGEGISVVDAEQKLLAWNGAYIDLFDYPDHLLRVGTPIEDLIHHNIEAGWITGDNPTAISEKRVQSMREGRRHIYERRNPDGRYLRIEGHPLPGGAYITTFRDITQDKQREEALRHANETLEIRVAQRTEDLRDMAEDRDRARQAAESANASKTRFLAAASHDLLQPLNAARLFLAAADEGDIQSPALIKAERAIRSADELLKGLLDISRLDQSDIQPRLATFPVGPMLEDLVEEAMPMAEEAGLSIRFVPSTLSVSADPVFLQSILRNFLSNARRYTPKGGVLIGARRAGDAVRLEVWDTGPGLSQAQQDHIFDEFYRGADADNLGVRGAGLGLSVVRRLADIMGADISVKSRAGRGSVFAVTLPRVQAVGHAPKPVSTPAIAAPAALKGLSVILVEDEPINIDALRALLGQWGCAVTAFTEPDSARTALSHHPEAILIADHDLGASLTGTDLIREAIAQGRPPERHILLTASTAEDVVDYCRTAGVTLIKKPADSARLRDSLSRLSRAQPGETASL